MPARKAASVKQTRPVWWFERIGPPVVVPRLRKLTRTELYSDRIAPLSDRTWQSRPEIKALQAQQRAAERQIDRCPFCGMAGVAMNQAGEMVCPVNRLIPGTRPRFGVGCGMTWDTPQQLPEAPTATKHQGTAG